MKKCKRCSNTYPDAHKFCNVCGMSAPKFSTVGSVLLSILKALAYFMLFEAVQVFTTLIFMILYLVFGTSGGGIEETVNNAMAGTLENACLISIVSGVLTAVFLFIFSVSRKKRFFDAVGIKDKIGFDALILAALGIALNFFTSLTMAFIPVSESLVEEYENLYSFIGEGNVIIEWLSVVLISPIVEELVFRGFMYRTLRKTTPIWFSALTVSVFFGAAHGNAISFVYTSLLGLVLIFVNEKTGSLAASVCVHIGFNLGSYLVSLIPDMNYTGYALILLAATAVTVALFAAFFALNGRTKKFGNNAESVNTGEENETL